MYMYIHMYIIHVFCPTTTRLELHCALYFALVILPPGYMTLPPEARYIMHIATTGHVWETATTGMYERLPPLGMYARLPPLDMYERLPPLDMYEEAATTRHVWETATTGNV